MGLCGFSLGSWGIYESTRTVESKVRSIEGKVFIGDGDDAEWRKIIKAKSEEANFKKFIEMETINITDDATTVTKLKKKCQESSTIRRWNWSYSKHYNDFLNYCTKEQASISRS